MDEDEGVVYRDFASHSDRIFCPVCAQKGDFSDPRPDGAIYPTSHPYVRAWKNRHHAHLYGMGPEKLAELLHKEWPPKELHHATPEWNLVDKLTWVVFLIICASSLVLYCASHR